MEYTGDEIPLPEDLRILFEERDEVEYYMTEASTILRRHKIGMKEPLVDSSGYPRSDLDLYEIRHARAAVNRLQAEYKVLSEKIEEAIHDFHRKIQVEKIEKVNRQPIMTAKCPRRLAILGTVVENSPAMLAGLREGDIIVEFGTVNGDNFRSLQDIGLAVQSNIDCYIKVLFERDGKLLRVNLRPKRWIGNGFLGCNILPVE